MNLFCKENRCGFHFSQVSIIGILKELMRFWFQEKTNKSIERIQKPWIFHPVGLFERFKSLQSMIRGTSPIRVYAGEHTKSLRTEHPKSPFVFFPKLVELKRRGKFRMKVWKVMLLSNVGFWGFHVCVSGEEALWCHCAPGRRQQGRISFPASPKQPWDSFAFHLKRTSRYQAALTTTSTSTSYDYYYYYYFAERSVSSVCREVLGLVEVRGYLQRLACCGSLCHQRHQFC